MVYTDKEFISQKIKNARIKAGLTQEKLAEHIGIGSQQVSAIESGKYVPSFETFLYIAEVLNLTLKDFGVNATGQENSIRDDFVRLIYTLNDTELECCYNVFKSQLQNFELLKMNKKKKNN